MVDIDCDVHHFLHINHSKIILEPMLYLIIKHIKYQRCKEKTRKKNKYITFARLLMLHNNAKAFIKLYE